VGGFVALLACLLVLGSIAEDVHDQEASALDALVTPLLHGLSNPTLDAVMGALTDVGSTVVVVPLLAVALALLAWRRDRREVLFLVVAMAGSLALNQSLKLIFHRPRPQLAWAQVQPEFSFPSGHAMNSLVFYVALTERECLVSTRPCRQSRSASAAETWPAARPPRSRAGCADATSSKRSASFPAVLVVLLVLTVTLGAAPLI
jgi:undecaprenyl-diphosphatase